MQEIFAHFPTPTEQQPSAIGGQIFALGYNPLQPVAASLEEYQAVLPGVDTSRKEQVLKELAVFQHATVDILLRKLGLSQNSYRHLQKQIQALHAEKPEDRYVEILIPPKSDESRFGSAPYVYTLGRQGYKYLRKRGVTVGRFRQLDAVVHEPFPLRHRLAVNEFLLKAQLLEREQAAVHLRDFRHEKYWNANPLRVSVPDREKPIGVSADLLLVFDTRNPPDEYWLLPEINLTEMWRKDWEEKVRAYCYGMAAYTERFGTTILTTIPVMVASPASFPRRVYTPRTPAEKAALAKERLLEAERWQKRMQNLLHWTEYVLDTLNMRQEADLFSFSAAPLDEISPTDLFYGPHWIIPFSDTPRPLMQTGKAGGQ